MRFISRIVVRAGAACIILITAGVARANSGIQLPLNQYAPASESAQLVTNGNFESGATGWTASGNITTAAPAYSNTSNNGLLSAQMNDTANPASYTQAAPAMTAGGNYVLSAYVWNAGRYDTSGGGFGDLVTIKLVDPGNPTTNNISMTLEGQASNGAAGSNGYFMYIMANQAQMSAWSTVDIQIIGEEGFIAGAITPNWAQWDNVGFTTLDSFAGQKWNVNSNGNYTDTSKWVGGQVPNAKGAVASFDTGGAGVRSVNVDAAVTLGAIRFNDSGSFTLASATNTITLDVGVDGFTNPQGVPELIVNQGDHTIAAPLSLPRPTIATIAGSSTLTVSGSITGTGTTSLTKNGAGTLVISGATTYGGDTIVNGGVLRFNGSAAWAPALAGPGTTDVAGSSVIFDYNDGSADPAATVQAILTTAYGSGFATGQIHSSTATADIGLGWKDDTGAKQVTVRRTYYGDADLNGTVDTVDFNLLAASFSLGSQVWFNGDFNYDGTVDTVDFNLLAANFSKTLPGDSFGTLVPEPGSMTAVALLALGLGRLRRRAAPGA